MENAIPHLNYQQFRIVQRLVHECCNNVDGNCLLLDNGWETCVCAQSISQSLICKYFRAAVLPLDRELEAVLLHRRDSKRCCRCGARFLPGSNRAKYCPSCALKVHRRQKTESEQKRRKGRQPHPAFSYLASPHPGFPDTDKLRPENRPELNIDIQRKDKPNTD